MTIFKTLISCSFSNIFGLLNVQSPRNFEPSYSQHHGSYGNAQKYNQSPKARHKGSGGRPPDPPPNNSIMFRGLNTSTSEETVPRFLIVLFLKITNKSLELMDYVKPYGSIVSVKVIRNRGTNVSRGIAFVEFQTIRDAVTFYDSYRQPDNPSSHKILIDGSNVDLKYSRPHTSIQVPQGDWLCPQCHINNFAKRNECFQCSTPRPVSNHSSVPEESIATLSILNLKPSTTKQMVIDAFSQFSRVVSCKMLWDKAQNISKGIAFVEFNSVEEANRVCSMKQPMFIDGVQVRVSFAKHNNSDTSQPQAYEQPEPPVNYNSYPQESSYSPISQPNTAYPISQHPQEAPPPSDPLAGIPDAHNYNYDPTSKYYFNPNTECYFDPESQFFYSLKQKEFYYFDRVKQEFVKHVSKDPLQETAPNQQQNNTQYETEPQQHTPTSAPTQNYSSTQSNQNHTSVTQSPNSDPRLKISQNQVESQQDQTVNPNQESKDIVDLIRLKLETTEGVICSLCKRKLQSNDALLKHNELSTLHKDNLQKAIQKHLAENKTVETNSLGQVVSYGSELGKKTSNPTVDQPSPKRAKVE